MRIWCFNFTYLRIFVVKSDLHFTVERFKKNGPSPFLLSGNSHINHVGMHDASGDANYNACLMLDLTYILRLNNLVKKNGPGQFPLADNCNINHIGMRDASGDANHNACFGCWIWPTFYGWTTWLRRTVQVNSRLLTTATSTILVCMMHLGMLTTMHASDAGSDLHFKVERLG